MISLRAFVDGVIYLHYRGCDFEILAKEFERRMCEGSLEEYLDLLVDLPCANSNDF